MNANISSSYRLMQTLSDPFTVYCSTARSALSRSALSRSALSLFFPRCRDQKTAKLNQQCQNSHFVGRSSFRLPRFLCGVVRPSSLSFSKSCSSRLGRNPFSWEGLRLRPWELSSARQEEGSLKIPFSTSLFSCLGKQASDVLSPCPPTSPLWTSAMDGLHTPV